jgi:hypothetical protein
MSSYPFALAIMLRRLPGLTPTALCLLEVTLSSRRVSRWLLKVRPLAAVAKVRVRNRIASSIASHHGFLPALCRCGLHMSAGLAMRA